MTDDPRDGERAEAEYQQFLLELRELAEGVLERVEPALRCAAAGVDQQEWAGCSWCPVCAALALLRGEHHDLAATVADHGVTMVTVFREAIAGTPVEPVMPDDVAAAAAPDGGSESGKRAYQPIRITIK